MLERDHELGSLATLIDETAAGEARLVLVEGPAGIGKTRLVTEARRRAGEPDCGCWALGAASWSGSTRSVWCGSSSSRRWRSAPRGEAAGRCGRRRRDGVRVGRHRGGRGRRQLVRGAARPVLADGEPERRAAAAARDRRPALVRPALACASSHTGAAARRAAGARDREPADRRGRRRTPALLAELLSDPLTVAAAPAAAERDGGHRARAQRLGGDADEVFAAACHEATGGNPLLLNELLKALETEGVRPLADNVATVRELGPRAASRAVLVRLARPARRRGRGGARRRRAGRRCGPARPGRARRRSSCRPAATATGELARAEIMRYEQPLGFVHPLVGGAVLPGRTAGRARAAARARGEAPGGGGRAGRAGGRARARDPAARRGHGSSTTLRRPPASAAQGRRRERSGISRARTGRAAFGESTRSCLLELGLAEALTSGPAAAEHLPRCVRGARRPAVARNGGAAAWAGAASHGVSGGGRRGGARGSDRAS